MAAVAKPCPIHPRCSAPPTVGAPSPTPSSTSSRRPLASEALESLATAAMAVCRSRAPWPSSFFHSEHPSQHHHHLRVFA